MLEARIIVEAPIGTRRKVVFYDPANMKVVDTNMKIADDPGEIDRAVRKVKDTLERAGNRVTVLVR